MKEKPLHTARRLGLKSVTELGQFFGLNKDTAYRKLREDPKTFEALALGKLCIELGMTADKIKAAHALSGGA